MLGWDQAGGSCVHHLVLTGEDASQPAERVPGRRAHQQVAPLTAGAHRAPFDYQVSLIEAGDWDKAMAETGHSLPWWHRRANLLVEGFDLPQTGGVRLRIGAEVLLEITQECDPCSRMEEIAEGLKAALTGDWRGGALARVLAGGTTSVGDTIRIEQ